MTDDQPNTDDSERVQTDGGSEPDASEPREDVRTDGGGTGIVPPDDETPTWSERKQRKQGLSRLTYEYFERSRREDQDLREESSYVERDVLAFPTWPHEMIRNLSLASFFVGMILFLAATLPPHLGPPADPSSTPSVILPDWYLYWSFGLLKLGPLNPELAILGGDKLMADRTYGVVANLVVVGFVAIVPFLNKGSARRPVEQPFWAAVGMAGFAFAWTISVLSIKNIVSSFISSSLLLDLTFLLPIVVGTITYAVLKSMREGYMFDLNRRYYRLRPPK